MHRLPDIITVPAGFLGTITAESAGERYMAIAIAVCTLVIVLPKAMANLWKLIRWIRELQRRHSSRFP